MSAPAYESYKDSGVEWLGQVPSHWDVKRLAHYFDERRTKVSDKDFPPLSVTKNGILPQLDTAAKTDDGDNRKLVLAGDFVINSRSDRKGSSGLSLLDGSVSLINTVLHPQTSMNGKFAHHLLRSVAFQEEYYRYGKGIVADLWSTNFSESRNILLAVPPTAEQTAIAAFLDRETGKIDALIEAQTRLIELLKEKRQAVISHAVTKGLNPDAPMKDSGIEWLGQVPAHWDLRKFTHAVNVQEGPGIMAADFHEAGVPLLRVAGAQSRWASLKGCNFLDPEKVQAKWDHFRLKEGDLVISGSASTGTVCEVGPDTAGAVPYTGLIRITPVKGVTEKDYIRSFVISSAFLTQIDQLKAGATIQHYGPTHLSRMLVTVPPLSEQKQISEAVDRIAATFDALTTISLEAMTLLQERRAALISAAVTGKIDVRGLVNIESEAA